jgi:hypothetical protein
MMEAALHSSLLHERMRKWSEDAILHALPQIHIRTEFLAFCDLNNGSSSKWTEGRQ